MREMQESQRNLNDSRSLNPLLTEEQVRYLDFKNGHCSNCRIHGLPCSHMNKIYTEVAANYSSDRITVAQIDPAANEIFEPNGQNTQSRAPPLWEVPLFPSRAASARECEHPSAESSRSLTFMPGDTEGGFEPGSQKPANSNAATGIYTCIYPGCTLRFKTPQEMKRHKRDCLNKPMEQTSQTAFQCMHKDP